MIIILLITIFLLSSLVIDALYPMGSLIASTISKYNNETGKFAKFSKDIQESKLLHLSNSHVIWPTGDVSSKALKERPTGTK